MKNLFFKLAWFWCLLKLLLYWHMLLFLFWFALQPQNILNFFSQFVHLYKIYNCTYLSFFSFVHQLQTASQIISLLGWGTKPSCLSFQIASLQCRTKLWTSHYLWVHGQKGSLKQAFVLSFWIFLALGENQCFLLFQRGFVM